MLDVLRVLTTVGDINKERWEERFDWMKVREGEYFILVVTDESGKVVGTGAVVVERKLSVILSRILYYWSRMFKWKIFGIHRYLGGDHDRSADSMGGKSRS